MDISVIIAQIVGIFFAVAGIAMIVNSKGVAEAVEQSVENKGILFAWGILALLIGAVIVTLNDAWATGMQALITVIGWLALIKGAFILFFPNAAAWLYRKFNKPWLLVVCGIVALVIGVFLIYW